MPDISLITSLYKSQQFLPQYIALAKKLARDVKKAGLDLELVIIPNEASENEQNLLRELQDFLHRENIATVQIHDVERESLYASWNRGLSFAKSDVFGFWNVDDSRTAEGLIEGHRLLTNAADMVDFAIKIDKQGKIEQHPPQYQADNLSPAKGVGPFFMFNRRLYKKAGKFIPDFRITGDFEWSKRKAVMQSNTVISDVLAGTFVLHGDNLSGGTSSEWIEFNIALLIHDAAQLMRPVDPDLMRQYWESWGHQYADISDESATWLWGKDALARYQRFRWERNLPSPARRILLALAKRGLIYSADWEIHHGKASTR